MDIHAISALFGIIADDSTELDKGHINSTFLVTARDGSKYILQSLNRRVFPSPEAVMRNISVIEAAFACEEELSVPRFLRCNGMNYAEQGGEVWSMYPYATGTECPDRACLAGFSHGRFIRVLSREGTELTTAIEGFHDYSSYMARLREVSPQCRELSRLEALGQRLGEVFADVPKRNIHGDAKADNIIIGKPCTVIDLDTAMYGYAAIDYGDMVRSADISALPDLTKGFAEGLGGLLTEKEVRSLYFGVLWVTGELAVRYLTDVYAENRYFSGKTREQCRERADSLLKQLDVFEGMRSHIEGIIASSK